MKAITYLLLTRTKNKILSIRKKPRLMILYGFILLICVAWVLFMIFAGENPDSKEYADSRILYLFISGFALLYLYTFTNTGLSIGSTFFTMADVSLLFVAPISTKKILSYGLLSTIGKTMVTSIFILYQIPNIVNLFGYGVWEIVALLFIYALMIIFCQILSIGIYIFSNGDQNRKSIVRWLLYIFMGVLILVLYEIVKKEQVGILDGLKLLVDSIWYGYIPVLGWSTMFFKGVVTGSLMQILISLTLFILISSLIILLLTARDADYYEDVLYSTEISDQRLKNYKEGRNISSSTNRKIKVKENEKGLGRGKGARILFYKHLLEIKRSSSFIFIDNQTIIFAIGVGVAGYFIKQEMGIYIILSTLIYMQYFATVFGRLKIELVKPYIYLLPESSFKKLLAASLSSLLKPCVDSIFIFGALALVGAADILQCVFMAIAYSASGAVFVGLTIVYQRVFGTQLNKLAQIIIGIFIMLLVVMPGVVASVLISVYWLPESLQFLSTLPYSAICLLIAFVMFLSCRNLLDKAEYSEQL